MTVETDTGTRSAAVDHHCPPAGSLADEVFDVAVIGGGVVGCATARAFTLAGARVALLERAGDILDGASKANSAILHTGFDATPGTLEHKCVQDGYREYRQIHHDLGLPLEQCGAYVVAWNSEQEDRLETIVEKAHKSAVNDCEIIPAARLLQNEPHLAPTARAAVAVPREAIIDPWSAPYVYLRQALGNGAAVFCHAEVTDGGFDGDNWHLTTARGTLKARQVINCAGLYGDQLDEKLLGSATFAITPRKGQFVVFDKAAANLINAVILPVPTSRTKGVVLFRTVFGNLAVGPTAEDQQSRSDTSTTPDMLEMLVAYGIEKLPGLADIPVTATYAGLRPACARHDYQVESRTGKNWITIGAVRSTGLSAALGIARHVLGLYLGQGHDHTPLTSPAIPRANVLAQSGERDWKLPGHGEIVCHCELVTEREINRALHGPLAATSLQGLKRQTRVTMGRCQGFYCSARLAELTEGHFDLPLARENTDD